MLKAINAKILLAILAALTLIGGLLVHQNHVSERAAANAAKATQILQQQQKEHDDAVKQDAASEEHIRQIRARQHNGAPNSTPAPKP